MSMRTARILESDDGDQMKLKINDRRFYAPHGVVTLVAVEERDFDGTKSEYYVLERQRGGTILLPTIGSDFRDLITASEAKSLQKKVKSKAKPKIDESVDVKARVAAHTERLKEGKASDYTAILHEMLYRAREGKLSAGEQKLLDTASSYFVEEVALVLKIATDKIRDDLDALSRPDA